MRRVLAYLRSRRLRAALRLDEKRVLDAELRRRHGDDVDRDRLLDRAKRGGYNVPTRL